MLSILHEDADLIAVDKPSGSPVHPSPGHGTGAMTDELVGRFPEMRLVGSAERPGVVHRLDVETSGVMLFARTPRAYLALRRLFESHQGLVKTYLAVLHGAPAERTGTVDAPLKGLRAVSHWSVLGRSGSLALVEFVIETGRTHQIRRHAKMLGHPVVGDRLYGVRDRAKRLLLHAVRLELTHPFTGRPLVLVSPPPPEIVYPHA